MDWGQREKGNQPSDQLWREVYQTGQARGSLSVNTGRDRSGMSQASFIREAGPGKSSYLQRRLHRITGPADRGNGGNSEHFRF